MSSFVKLDCQLFLVIIGQIGVRDNDESNSSPKTFKDRASTYQVVSNETQHRTSLEVSGLTGVADHHSLLLIFGGIVHCHHDRWGQTRLEVEATNPNPM